MINSQQFKVNADNLNLRSTPRVAADNRIAVLPKDHIVFKLGDADDDSWWEVTTTFEESKLIGFVAHRFLSSTGSSDLFDFLEPSSAERVKNLSIWATFYNVHTAQVISGGEPLLDMSGKSLGLSLSTKDWCNAAMEGTVRVLGSDSNVIDTYNFAGTGLLPQVDCSSFFPSLPSNVISGTNRVRFKVSKGLYGEGTAGFILAPYRTIAVDKSFISIGSVIYIPDARGIAVTLPSGIKITHDGYFFAADVGGAIKDNHIDGFLGIASKNPFPFIKSTSTSAFEAFLIHNTLIEKALKASHTR